jgi:hypothetical protein
VNSRDHPAWRAHDPAERHEVQEVVETVVAQALIEAVVTQDKTVTFRCRYRLKTSERQRLELELPKKDGRKRGRIFLSRIRQTPAMPAPLTNLGRITRAMWKPQSTPALIW